jgi:hypothetical protein
MQMPEQQIISRAIVALLPSGITLVTAVISNR